jgi:lactoylglutathione lyase
MAFASARLRHAMIRVRDLDRSLRFYLGGLGMAELRRESYPAGRFTLVFVGYGGERTDTVIELTHNWGHEGYEHGTGFGHLAIGVADLAAAVESLRGRGARVVREPGPMKYGTERIAFVEDPDGYRIELIEVA